MALFGKKKEAEPVPVAAPPPSGLPVEQIISMRNQGYTNNQIIQALQRDGFTSQQLCDAMKQADLSSAVGAPLPEEEAYPEAEVPEGMPPPEAEPFPQEPGAGAPMPPPPMGAAPERAEHVDTEKIEEIAEAIIDEKWEEIAKNINKVIEWKETVESRIHDIEADSKKLKADFDRLHSSILGKIGEYDQNILNVGTEIKAMEKVFQKILPTLTENVSQLTRVTEKFKK